MFKRERDNEPQPVAIIRHDSSAPGVWSLRLIDREKANQALKISPEWAPMGWDTDKLADQLSDQEMERLFIQKVALVLDFSVGNADDEIEKVDEAARFARVALIAAARAEPTSVVLKGTLWDNGDVSTWMEMDVDSEESGVSEESELLARHSMRIAAREKLIN